MIGDNDITPASRRKNKVGGESVCDTDKAAAAHISNGGGDVISDTDQPVAAPKLNGRSKRNVKPKLSVNGHGVVRLSRRGRESICHRYLEWRPI